mmetsp:Transcript_26556/g.64752  ORF Transcript_26556/g.64752 Transcript_26556/m.64752 type:complete len:279 (-) Transcript_26556:402-1238(-)
MHQFAALDGAFRHTCGLIQVQIDRGGNNLSFRCENFITNLLFFFIFIIITILLILLETLLILFVVSTFLDFHSHLKAVFHGTNKALAELRNSLSLLFLFIGGSSSSTCYLQRSVGLETRGRRCGRNSASAKGSRSGHSCRSCGSSRANQRTTGLAPIVFAMSWISIGRGGGGALDGRRKGLDRLSTLVGGSRFTRFVAGQTWRQRATGNNVFPGLANLHLGKDLVGFGTTTSGAVVKAVLSPGWLGSHFGGRILAFAVGAFKRKVVIIFRSFHSWLHD